MCWAVRDRRRFREKCSGYPRQVTNSQLGSSARDSLRTTLRETQQQYSDGNPRPLKAYLGLMGTYLTMVGALSALVRRLGRPLPTRLGAGDIALVAVATHKAARMVTKETVTSPLRAPFTTFRGAAGDAELHEDVTAPGARHAVGELLTCPFCTGHWIATVLVFGLVIAPRATRLVCAILTAVAGSDALQLLYASAQHLEHRAAG